MAFTFGRFLVDLVNLPEAEPRRDEEKEWEKLKMITQRYKDLLIGTPNAPFYGPEQNFMDGTYFARAIGKRLRKVWQLKGRDDDPYKIGPLILELDAYYQGRIQDHNIDPTAFRKALTFLQQQRWLRECNNKDCDHFPYFIAREGHQKYCSKACFRVVYEQQQREYEEKGRKKLQMERKGGKK